MFYALVGVIALLGIFAVGVWLGQSGSAPARQATAASAQSAQSQPKPGSQVAKPITSKDYPGANPFDVPGAVKKVQRPVGDSVPVGDNPRLALPDISASDYTYDFGDISPNAPVSTIIRVANTGKKDLVLNKIQAQCGCTGTTLAGPLPLTVKPGESTEVRVQYDPGYEKEAGKKITRTVQIESNDPAAPTVEFAIKANVLNQ